MSALTLGFKAFDAHELLCHFIAVKSGLYKKHHLEVELVDISFVAENELPGNWFQASCGAALSSAVKGIPQRIVFVATDKPMFWIYANSTIFRLEELKNKRLVTFPVFAPPHHLANIILAKSGLNGGEDVSLHPARDDAARLGLLKSGDADAAVISSAMAPAKLAGLGFNTLCFFGNEVRIPTTGLAIDQSYLDQNLELTNLMMETHKQCLSLIHQDVRLVQQVLEEVFDVASEHSETTASLYQTCYTTSGSTSAEIAQSAIDAVSKSMGKTEKISWQDIYRFN